jgi:nucleoside-specific outer membrane channel protein Tsx
MLNKKISGYMLALALFFSFSCLAEDWSKIEVQYQYGTLDTPEFAGGGDEETEIWTVQYAGDWKYGDNFFFVDLLESGDTVFNNSDAYLEWYTNFSLGKITGNKVGFGSVRDIGIIFGINYGADENVKKYLPGVRFSLDLPGFTFANLDLTAYIDDNAAVGHGGAPAEDDSFMIDFNWAYPFSVGNQDFSIEGHIEYIGERDNELDDTIEAHVLAQPQFRWDAGKAWFEAPQQLFIGIEYQYWQNKLGDKDTDESTAQLLAVWRF